MFMVTTQPAQPELAVFGDRTGSRPPLAAVLVGVDDHHHVELVVSVDPAGLATVELFGRGLQAQGVAPIAIQHGGSGTTVASGAIDVIGYDKHEDQFVSGRIALALGWSNRPDAVEVIGTAFLDGVWGDEPTRFQAVAFHPSNCDTFHRQVEMEATLIPFPCHRLQTQPET